MKGKRIVRLVNKGHLNWYKCHIPHPRQTVSLRYFFSNTQDPPLSAVPSKLIWWKCEHSCCVQNRSHAAGMWELWLKVSPCNNSQPQNIIIITTGSLLSIRTVPKSEADERGMGSFRCQFQAPARLFRHQLDFDWYQIDVQPTEKGTETDSHKGLDVRHFGLHFFICSHCFCYDRVQRTQPCSQDHLLRVGPRWRRKITRLAKTESHFAHF